MPSNTLVQARIDPAVKKRAAAIFDKLGITVSDAVRILLTRTAKEGAPPFPLTMDLAAHDAWFRAQVQAALDDDRPAVPRARVEAHFAARRAAARRSKP